jgi:uncharacterized protein (DUF2147 family)
MSIRSLLILISLALFSTASAAERADAILGLWTTEGDKARVGIAQENGVYAGRIVWLKEPLYPADDSQGMSGKPKVDRKNPDIALRARPILGLALVNGFHYAGSNVWSGGTIYDPESGKIYSCKITLMANGSLQVRGYIGISLFGRTTVWARTLLAPASKTVRPVSRVD